MDPEVAPAPYADLSIRDFAERLSSSAPVPGGGSAAAVAASLGASLVAMVCAVSSGRPRFAAYEATLTRCAPTGLRLSAELLRLADIDSAAYARYAAALKMPRETEAEREARRKATEAAARDAASAPWECVRACVELAAAVEALAGRSNPNASSDLLVAALLADAGARGAAENVRVNLPATGDEPFNETMGGLLHSALHDVDALTARTREIVLSGRMRDPEAA